MLSFLHHKGVWFSRIMPLVNRRLESKKKIIGSAENKTNAGSLGQIKDEITCRCNDLWHHDG